MPRGPAPEQGGCVQRAQGGARASLFLQPGDIVECAFEQPATKHLSPRVCPKNKKFNVDVEAELVNFDVTSDPLANFAFAS